MKKIFALLMTVSLLFTLAACKSNEKPSNDNSTLTADTVAFTARPKTMQRFYCVFSVAGHIRIG